MKFFCDYSLVGRSMEFPVIVTKLEREELRFGSLVWITRDGIPDRQGVVVRLASNSVVAVWAKPGFRRSRRVTLPDINSGQNQEKGNQRSVDLDPATCTKLCQRWISG